MNNGSGLSVFLGFIGLAVLGRFLVDQLDRQRIRENLAERGCAVLEIHWNPFGPGWFGEKGERIYEVIYETRAGERVVANYKTSLFSGVYWHGAAGQASIAGGEPAPEPMNCLACGKPMGGKSICPACGWSYKGEP